MTSRDRLFLLASVANLYYVQGQSQAQIAREVGYSRSGISRLLTEAHQKGIVTIQINYPLERAGALEQRLAERFSLRRVLVAQRGNLAYPQALRQVGRLAAAYLTERLADDMIIGLSWGMAVHEVVQAVEPRRLRGVKVVQMIGGVGQGDPEMDGAELARNFARTIGADAYTLNAPHIVGDPSTRDSLLEERDIQTTIRLARKADYALVGIGSVTEERSAFLRAGYLTAADLKEIQAEGLVGDICGSHFDALGRVSSGGVNRRIVGITLEQLTAGQTVVVGVAAGRIKAPAIRAALRGDFLDVLVTDSNAARAILEG